ncbi:uncharacterized protein LOC135711324 [Ochlerotatus camptorhynchus]|uniref:uncharacterized protein LOC135711324 n=1 Tax=Ochlerotatus camptorhynchus TaxID=644619 RepID=UPI0031CECDE9
MYETSIDSFQPDPNIAEDYITLGTLRVTRKKRNSYIIIGDFELQQNWGNENMVSFALEPANKNGPPLMAGKKNFCEFLNMDNAIIDEIRVGSNLPPKGTCPLPKGKYQIENFELTEDMLPPILPKGQYVLNARMDNVEGRQVMAYKVYATVK